MNGLVSHGRLTANEGLKAKMNSQMGADFSSIQLSMYLALSSPEPLERVYVCFGLLCCGVSDRERSGKVGRGLTQVTCCSGTLAGTPWARVASARFTRQPRSHQWLPVAPGSLRQERVKLLGSEGAISLGQGHKEELESAQ